VLFCVVCRCCVEVWTDVVFSYLALCKKHGCTCSCGLIKHTLHDCCSSCCSSSCSSSRLKLAKATDTDTHTDLTLLLVGRQEGHPAWKKLGVGFSGGHLVLRLLDRSAPKKKLMSKFHWGDVVFLK